MFSSFRNLGWSVAVLLFAGLLIPSSAAAVDVVTLKREDSTLKVEGKVLVEAEDGGLLLVTNAGRYWAVEAEELVSLARTATPFKPLTQKEVAKKLLAELPEGFNVHYTKHYVVCYNTSRAYAKWCGALYERLHRGFMSYWKTRGFKLKAAEFPLVAIVHANQKSYVAMAASELGESADRVIGYYSFRTNRVMMYDLTGISGIRRAGDQRGSSAQINRVLARPAAAQGVATIIHESTHQLAFNSGLQARYADVPVWVSEGMAMFFETPDLKSSKGWRSIGAVNRARLIGFQTYLPARPANSLVSLISSDDRLRDSRQALDAYAESWALTYFLIRRYPKQYTKYMEGMSRKEPYFFDKPVDRIKEFKAAFGNDLERLDREFVDTMRKLR